MARGKSGRMVIEVDEDLKNHLYVALCARNLTLKDWFIQAAKELIADHQQPQLLPKRPPGQVG
jgi:hypothetical protein